MHPNSAAVVCAPTWGQLSHFWATMREIWFCSRLPRLFPGVLILDGSFESRAPIPTWRIVGLSGESGERVEGVHGSSAVLLVLDECKAIPDPVIDSLFQMLGGHGDEAKVLAISTPGRPSGRFYEFFTKHAEKWKTLTTSAADIPRLRSHFEEQRDEHGEDSPFFQMQLAAQFADVDDGESVLPFEAVRRAVERPKIVRDEYEPPWPGVLGVDPAGRGADLSVAAFRRGPNVISLHLLGRGRGDDEMEVVGRIVALADRLHAQTIVIDVAGLGGPMESRLREVYKDKTRRPVRLFAFNAGWKAHDNERFANAKTELLYQVRSRLLAKDPMISLPDDPALVAELTGYRTVLTSNGRTRTVDPDPSPDRADAAILSFFADGAASKSFATHRPKWLGY
jgi:hypothetical protein